ncbi:cytochrome P450 [Actinomadura welshii]|uniref:cytochrome P450 n=1 Tax=Actinomadura welshii TaxID=3103817 RepID=UPI0003AD7570|nr:cytochrome P450 [Actinomadura madurae]
MTTTMPALDIDPFTDDVLADPTDFHRRLRAAGPAVKVRQSEGLDLVAVGRDRDVRDIYADHENFLNSRGSGVLDLQRDEPFREPGLLLEHDPPAHTAVRTVMADVISPRHVRGLRTSFQAAADDLVDRLLDLKTFDAQKEFAEAFPLRVVPDAVMGAPEEGRENLLRYSVFLFESMGPRTPRARRVLEQLPDVEGAIAWVRDSCRRENVRPGSFGALIWEAVDRGELTEEQAPNLVRSLLGAGIDTTIHSLAVTLHLLVSHQDQWALLRDQPGRGRFAFDEALRHQTTVRQNFRTPARDLEIDGVPVREGQKIMLVPGAANRDPERWGESADVFDITRDSGGHLALGRGVHQCAGAPVARLEADTLLSTFARRVKGIEFAGTPVPLLNNTLRGWSSLPVTITAA